MTSNPFQLPRIVQWWIRKQPEDRSIIWYIPLYLIYNSLRRYIPFNERFLRRNEGRGAENMILFFGRQVAILADIGKWMVIKASYYIRYICKLFQKIKNKLIYFLCKYFFYTWAFICNSNNLQSFNFWIILLVQSFFLL